MPKPRHHKFQSHSQPPKHGAPFLSGRGHHARGRRGSRPKNRLNTRQRARGNTRRAWAIFGLIAALLCLFALGPYVGSGPRAIDLTARYAPPSFDRWLGADHLGRDVLARVLTAGTLNVGIAVASAVVALTAGAALGATSGYVGGWLDHVVMRLFDVWQSIPGLLFGLLVMAVFGKGIVPLMTVISLAFVPTYARMVRSEIRPQRRGTLVEAARLSGVSETRLLLVYVLPQHLTAAIAYLPIQAAYAMGMTAGLGFIGLGVKPSTPEWGAMISEGMSDLIFLGTWWTTLPAGLLLGLTSLLLFQGGTWLAGRLAGDTYQSILGGDHRARKGSTKRNVAHSRADRHV